VGSTKTKYTEHVIKLHTAVLIGSRKLCSTFSWIVFFSCVWKCRNTNSYNSPMRRLFALKRHCKL